MIRLLDRFLLLQPRWLSTILFIPLLYALGWLAAMLLTVLGLPYNAVSLTGTVLSFVLFVLAMPRWAAKRWSVTRAWTALGICNGGLNDRRSSAVGFLQGLLIATGLLTIITTLALIGGWGQWLGNLDIRSLLNALLLCFGVGLAEELIFRGWLWAELNQSIGAARGFIAQAVVFSLVHTRFNLNLPEMLGLLLGLFLLGLLLATLRHLHDGSLWGSVGLHGGLIAIWFLLDQNLVDFSPKAPWWLLGPGGNHPNPIGGLTGLILLATLLRIGKSKAKKTNEYIR